MKDIFYYLFPILGVLFLISCEDDDKVKGSFMETHKDTKWVYEDGDSTIYLHIDMDKIHDYHVHTGGGDCCTWSTATGSHTSCDGDSYTNMMLVNSGDTLEMKIIYAGGGSEETHLMIVDGSSMSVKHTYGSSSHTEVFTKTTEALPSVTCLP